MLLQRACYAAIDGFTDLGSGNTVKRREVYMELVASLLALFLSIIIIAFIGKWLWNNIVVDLFTVVKPARNVWQIIGLMVFWALVR
jgi:hypothetical protein